MRAPRTLVTGLLLLAAVLLGACADAEGTNDGGYISGDGQIVQYPADERAEPVELSGESLTGEPIDVADHLGEVVVVNTWWSGCPPCRTEMPMLTEAADELAGTATFLGINIRDNSPQQGLAFERNLGVDYPSIYDPSGRALLAFHGRVNPRTIPTTVLLDEQGRVAAVVNGEIPSKLTLTELVEEIAAEGGGSAGDG